MTVTLGIVIMAAVIVALSAWLVIHLVGNLERRLNEIERNHEARIAEVEQDLRKRHTHRTEAGIEDALAVGIDLLIKQRADQARTEQLLDILRLVREGPHKYDPDRPAGKRPEGWE